MKTKTLHLLLALLAMTSASARTINWGNSPDDTLLTSTGAALDDSFTFEVGSFGSFLPDQSNLSQWAANWKVFDRATAVDGTWNSGASWFSSSADVLAAPFPLTDGISSKAPPLPTFTFASGEQGYIWVYNTQNLTPGVSEWALVTNDQLANAWAFPSPSDHGTTPLEWRLINSSTVIFGGLNDVQGPGEYTPPGVNYELQTHVIPEPSGALMIALVGVLLRLRRKGRTA
jgi:hypothetical protein